MARPKARYLAPLVSAFLVFAAVGLSAAAGMSLGATSRAPVIKGWSRCSGQVSAAVTGTTVNVSGIDADCSGKALAVYVHSATGTISATATASGSTAAFTLPSQPAGVDGVLVTAGTWPLPTAWSQPSAVLPAVACAPASGSGTCTATISDLNYWGWPTTSDYNLTVKVDSVSSTPVTWQVTINLSSADLPVLASDLSDTQGGLVKVSATSCAASPRTVTVKGTTGWGSYHQVKAGQTQTLQVHGFTSGSGGLINC